VRFKLEAVDYVALNGELFGALDATGAGSDLLDDEEQWRPGLTSPNSAASLLSDAAASNGNEGDDDNDSDLLEVSLPVTL
jgi:hypothetical protein